MGVQWTRSDASATMSGVTKIDERAQVPPLDDAAKECLGGALDDDGVVATLLIGSPARGDSHPLSDVDIAVWHRPDLDSAERLRLPVDLVMLSSAPPLLQHRAISEGVRLAERGRRERIRRAATVDAPRVEARICIDLGTQIVIEISAPAPSSYVDCTTLGQRGIVPSELATHLADAARLEDLRQFAALAESRLG